MTITTTTEPAVSTLVDADWAIDHLDHPSVRFIEVDVDTTAYGQGHLPGAVAWDWTTQLTDPVRRDIVTAPELQALLRAAGVDHDTQIVLYGDHGNWFAAWAYWQLKLHDIERVSLLDGGRAFWLATGRPITTDASTPSATDIVVGPASDSLRAFRDEILARLGDTDLRLVDVRSPAEYSGEVLAPPGLPESAQRAGHIPGARSVPWSSAIREDGTFRSRDELAALYAAAGVTGDHDIVAYCRIGERSSHTWFVLHELLGYERVRNYDGSWTEYGSLVGVPIEVSSDVHARRS